LCENMVVTVLKALIKGKLHIGTLTGFERFFLSQITLPDRVPTLLAATNVEPYLIDAKYDYVVLTENPEANLELYTILKERYAFDVMITPVWTGLLLTGASELGVKFRIDRTRVPYAYEHVINSIEDIDSIALPSEPTGYFQVYLDTIRTAQQRLSGTMITYINDGPWDLAMLLRGDKYLPRDFRIYKDYTETQDPVRREKIKAHGDPHLWPAIMELTTRITIQNFNLARQYGINMFGAMMVDQFATRPVLGVSDFLTYVLPYIQRVWEALDKKVEIGYMVQSPQELEELSKHPILGKSLGLAGYTNYIFPQTKDGLTLPEYDQPMLELAKRNKKNYNYLIHGKYLRDATGEELENAVKRICQMATSMKTGLIVAVGSVPPGTDLNNIDVLLRSVEMYGKY